jgi:hypothetical protein
VPSLRIASTRPKADQHHAGPTSLSDHAAVAAGAVFVSENSVLSSSFLLTWQRKLSSHIGSRTRFCVEQNWRSAHVPLHEHKREAVVLVGSGGLQLSRFTICTFDFLTTLETQRKARCFMGKKSALECAVKLTIEHLFSHRGFGQGFGQGFGHFSDKGFKQTHKGSKPFGQGLQTKPSGLSRTRASREGFR